jgi:hypothetical protein
MVASFPDRRMPAAEAFGGSADTDDGLTKAAIVDAELALYTGFGAGAGCAACALACALACEDSHTTLSHVQLHEEKISRQ